MADIFCIAWLARADWLAWKRLDPEDLPASHDEWLEATQASIEELKRDGGVVEIVAIDPNQCLAWCEGRGTKVDYHKRAEYAAFVVASRRHD